MCHPTSPVLIRTMCSTNPALRGKNKDKGKCKAKSKRKARSKRLVNQRQEKRCEKQQTPEPIKAMSEPNQKPKRKYKRHLRVPVEPGEGEVIGTQAEKCGLSISEYLRKLGLGYEPASIVDNQKVDELAKINGDLGRLGGLLKLWLSDDRRAAHFDKQTIIGLLKDIEETRRQMTRIMMHVIKSDK